MEGLRLLERLAAYEENPESRGIWNAESVMASVLDHLRPLLNTRQGSAMIAEDLGMPDFTNMIRSFDDMTCDQLSVQIKTVLEKYEPRLANVQIGIEPKDVGNLKLRFRIEGKLRLPHGNMDVSFETIVDPEGKIELV